MGFMQHAVGLLLVPSVQAVLDLAMFAMHVPHAFFGQIVKLLSRLLKTVSEADVDHARIADAMSAATVAVCAALRSCPSMRAAGYHG